MSEILMALLIITFIYAIRAFKKGFDKGLELVKEELSQLEEKNFETSKLQLAIEAVETVAATTVGKLEEIYSKEIRKKIMDGEADKQELFEVANEAYNEILSVVGEEVINVLDRNISDTELYIKNQIEKQLLLLKIKLKGGDTGA